MYLLFTIFYCIKNYSVSMLHSLFKYKHDDLVTSIGFRKQTYLQVSPCK